MDGEINDLFRDFESLTRPTAAFITFEEEDAMIIAKQIQTGDLVLNQPFKMRVASEPTDIIWENRHFTEFDYFRRQIIAFIIIGVLLFGSFIVMYKVARTSAEIAREFPPTDCNAIASTYGS